MNSFEISDSIGFTSDEGSETYFCDRLAVPLAAAISIMHNPPSSLTGNQYLRERKRAEKKRGERERYGNEIRIYI